LSFISQYILLLNLQHKLNGGEQKIGKFKVDGLCRRTVYEFNGCLWYNY